MLSLLRLAGKNGAWVAISGVVIGFAVPAVSNAARPWLSVAIFLFSFGSFLRINLTASSLRGALPSAPVAALMVLWATLGVPAVVAAGILVLHPDPQLTQGLLFWALVPTSPACVAFCAILGLSGPLALLTTVVSTAATPLYMPWLAAVLGGYQLSINPAHMSLTLLMIIGGAAIAALVVQRFARAFVRENPDVMTGIAVFAIVLAGMGSMRGMQAYALAQPMLTFEYLLLAYGLTLGFQVLGSLLFWRSERTTALTVGLMSGTRTLTLAWVVLGPHIMPLADMFLAAGMVAKYTSPALTKALVAWFNRPATVPVTVHRRVA